ncbi:MAG: MFS transporter [Nitrososphaeria archaeon]|nr:MFS transporter [Nitrososphaeria archaeon]
MHSNTYSESKMFEERIALVATSLASFLVAYTISALNVALPSIGVEFGLSPTELGWIQNSYLLSSVIFLLPSGRLADLRGKRIVFLIGLTLFTFSSLTTYFVTSKELFYVIRLIQGAAAAMFVSTSVPIITSIFSKNVHGVVIGINTAAVYAGQTVGPYVGGFLTQNFGWRSIFLSVMVLGTLSLSITLFKVDDNDEIGVQKGKFDYIGTILYASALTTIVFSATYSNISSSFSSELVNPITLFAFGAVLFIIFIFWQLKTIEPLLDVRIFKYNRAFTCSNFTALMNYSATYMISLLLSIYLQLVRRLTPENTGLILVTQPLVQTIFSPLAGKLSDKRHPRLWASIGIGINTVGIFFLTFLDQNIGLEIILFTLTIIGLGYALFSTPNTNALMSSVESKYFGAANATLSTMRQMGMILSTIISTLILTLFVGPVEISMAQPLPLVMGIKSSFLISSAICLVGTLVSLSGLELKKKITF